MKKEFLDEVFKGQTTYYDETIDDREKMELFTCFLEEGTELRQVFAIDFSQLSWGETLRDPLERNLLCHPTPKDGTDFLGLVPSEKDLSDRCEIR